MKSVSALLWLKCVQQGSKVSGSTVVILQSVSKDVRILVVGCPKRRSITSLAYQAQSIGYIENQSNSCSA